MYFLADENHPFDAVRRLREAGHDVAAIYGRLLYKESLEELLVPVGIVYFRFDPSPPEEPADYLLALLEQPGFSVVGKFTVVERDRVRQRPLPEAG